MSRFEHLLAAQVALILAGCTGDAAPDDTGTTEPPYEPDAWCAGTLTEGYELEQGYVTVELGGTCPDVADLDSVEDFGCDLDIARAVCAFVEKDENQVSDYYGGFMTYDPAYPYLGDPVDVCRYMAVFEQSETEVTCGPPLLSDGAPVVAPVRRRADWQAAIAAVVRDPQQGAWWLEVARLEHASVASFARFTLELVRFGAPPELVADAHRAGLDEVEHARLAFALASAFLGEDVGPDGVDLTGAATLAPDRAAFAEAVLREGGIGETISGYAHRSRVAAVERATLRGSLSHGGSRA